MPGAMCCACSTAAASSRLSGKRLPCSFHSICVHGDNAHAVATAAAVRDGLLAAGHRLKTLPELFG